MLKIAFSIPCIDTLQVPLLLSRVAQLLQRKSYEKAGSTKNLYVDSCCFQNKVKLHEYHVVDQKHMIGSERNVTHKVHIYVYSNLIIKVVY